MKGIAPIFLITAAACLSSAMAATVVPDVTNRITFDSADSTRANTEFQNSIFSTYRITGAGTNNQRTLQYTSTATINFALATELGALGFGESYQITSATLTVGTSGDNYTDIATVHQLINSYPVDPAVVTWNSFNSGGVAGTDYATTASATGVAGANSATWDLTTVVQGWVSGGTNNGLIFITVADSATTADFTTNLGTWNITAVKIPEPSAALLGGLGMLLLLRRRRA